MTNLLLLLFGCYIGWKLNKAFTFLREVRNVKYIDKTIHAILSKGDIELIDLRTREERKNENDIDKDYEAFVRFKNSNLSKGEV